ncbi:MAG: chemotaxis protein CheW [Sphaerospermopsis sp.]|jgi:chemotaxis-related protein WspD|uniref:chemotaxis protein CheW n=1 Tax=Sphaerospermopsis sp. LEGE 00249 TaxID=1380707 RepID=UPI00164D50F7|nr:chemotaxis protein CheW [Sphaerospermopsis sp. LEGE 00249]MBC5796771.1 chemotaxis protein CheW [Sphaerospermopsis sp. LEGE 00249]MEB3149563.1 chemotaxis protein CheW [Sphaerospermopsis sp.]
MNSITELSNLESCWNVIGIAGDRTCPELSDFIHCRNCPVYSSAGRNLLERSIPANYQNEWTQFFSDTKAEGKNKLINFPNSSEIVTTKQTLTVAIFRLQREWLALPAHILKETISPTGIHTIPHRSNEILKGLVNIRGELQLCISLSNLLHLETIQNLPLALSPIVYSRMIVIEKGGNTWVFPVDEFYGLYQFDDDELRSLPNSKTSTINTYTKGFFHWQSCSLSLIDDELLFMSLKRKVLS